MKAGKGKHVGWYETGPTGAPAVVFLHAMAGSATAWKPQMLALGDNRRCIAWDMPGFGDADDPAGDATMDDIVGLLAEFVRDDLGLERADFVGLSVGGMILQHFAHAHPALAQSITILDSSPRFGHGGDMKPHEFVAPVLDQLETDSVAGFSQAMVRAITGPRCSGPALNEAIAAMSRARKSGLALTARLIGDHDALEKLGDINCPVLVMAGADDAETPPAYAHAIASLVPGAQVTIIPDAGHIVNLENPAAVNARLGFFLEHYL